MAWLIMNDEIDYTCLWYPTHIVTKDNKIVPVFIGASKTLLNGFIGLYIRNKDYGQIRHDKAYIFVHNPDATDEEVVDVDWDKIKDVKDQKTTGRDHIHLWKELEFEGEA